MSPSREDDDATIGPERKPAPAADQTLALPDASRAGSPSDATYQLPGAPAPAANDQTLAHDSVAPSVHDQTLAHDSLSPTASTAATVKKGADGWHAAGGVKLSVSPDAGTFVSRGGAAPEAGPTEHVPGYELLGELGRGAMGVVYKARQIGLKRVVALKMILSGGHASPGEVIRFRTEAEAVARLQHPYIVQVFEIGEYKGLPYFSLEFVEGGCLADKIMENPLALGQAADVVRKLAEGMACAHENGIVHRDLKPANVLLTREGDPKITDFGLAKKLEEDSGATRAGAIMGTPSYMAPEQAEGRTDLVGPHSDIYALGAILYDLITGRPPFRGATILETLTQVRSVDPVPPARLHPRMPRDLETITLKCLLKEPKKRYHTARDLAEDLRRFLAGEPILARPVSSLERTWKWCKRRPAAAALIGVSALLLVSMAVGGVAYARSERLRAEEAERLTQDVKEQRDRAEGHFRQAREAVDQMLSRVGQEQLGYEPRMEQVRRDLLEKAASFYDRFMQAEGDDPSVRHEAANAARKVGDARELLGQRPEAEKAYRRALELLGPLVEGHAGNAAYRQDLAAACNNLANLLRESRRFDDADPLSARAVELFKRLADDLPREPVRRRELAMAYYNRALLERARGKPRDAALNWMTARNLQQVIAIEAPKDDQAREELARTLLAQGELQAASNPDEAAGLTGAAHGLYLKLVQNLPGNARMREGLMDTSGKLGDLWRNSRPASAGPQLRRAVELGEGLVSDFPTVPDYQQRLAGALNNLGLYQLADGKRDRARGSFERALLLKQRLAENFPKRPDYQRDLARSEGNVALQLLNAGLTAEAAPLCRRTVETMRRLTRDHPGNPADQRELAKALARLARFDPAAAEKALREAAPIQDRLVQSDPSSREYLAERAETYSALGAVLQTRGQFKEAEPPSRRADADYRELTQRYPEEPDYRSSSASARFNLGELFKATNRAKEAEKAWREAEAIFADLAKQHPTRPQYARGQAKALNSLGVLLRAAARYPEAEALHRQALALRLGLAEKAKDEPALRHELALTYADLAMALTYRNNFKAAEENFTKSIDVLERLRQDHPAETAHVNELLNQRSNYANLLKELGRDDDAIKHWRRRVALLEERAGRPPEGAATRSGVGAALHELGANLMQLRRLDEARAAYEDAARHQRQALKLAPGDDGIRSLVCLHGLGVAEARLAAREHAAAAKTVAEMLLEAPAKWAMYPVAAAVLAQCAGQAAGDAKIDEARRKEVAKEYGDRAMELLRKATAAGFKDADALGKAKEFEALRERDDFKKLLTEMAGK